MVPCFFRSASNFRSYFFPRLLMKERFKSFWEGARWSSYKQNSWNQEMSMSTSSLSKKGSKMGGKPCTEMQLILIPLAGFEHFRVTGTNQGHQELVAIHKAPLRHLKSSSCCCYIQQQPHFHLPKGSSSCDTLWDQTPQFHHCYLRSEALKMN